MFVLAASNCFVQITMNQSEFHLDCDNETVFDVNGLHLMSFYHQAAEWRTSLQLRAEDSKGLWEQCVSVIPLQVQSVLLVFRFNIWQSQTSYVSPSSLCGLTAQLWCKLHGAAWRLPFDRWESRCHSHVIRQTHPTSPPSSSRTRCGVSDPNLQSAKKETRGEEMRGEGMMKPGCDDGKLACLLVTVR